MADLPAGDFVHDHRPAPGKNQAERAKSFG